MCIIKRREASRLYQNIFAYLRTNFISMEKRNNFQVAGDELLKKIKEIIHEGNVNRIIIKNDEGKTYLEIPITIGVIGAALAPVFAAIGALAALAARFTIEVVRVEGKE